CHVGAYFLQLSPPSFRENSVYGLLCRETPRLHEVRLGADTGCVRLTNGRLHPISALWEYSHEYRGGHHETCSAAGCFSRNSAHPPQTGLFRNGKKASALLFC